MILFKKFEKQFNKAYGQIIEAEIEKPINEGEQKKEDKIVDTSKWRDLNNEDEFLELLDKLGFIDKQLENDIKMANEILSILDNKL